LVSKVVTKPVLLVIVVFSVRDLNDWLDNPSAILIQQLNANKTLVE